MPQVRKRLSPLLAVAAATALNLGGAALIQRLDVPLYMDSVCTFTLAALFGL